MTQLEAVNVAVQRYFKLACSRWEWNENLQDIKLYNLIPVDDELTLICRISGKIDGEWYSIVRKIPCEDIWLAINNSEYSVFNLLDKFITRMVYDINELAADPFELWVREVRRENGIVEESNNR